LSLGLEIVKIVTVSKDRLMPGYLFLFLVPSSILLEKETYKMSVVKCCLN